MQLLYIVNIRLIIWFVELRFYECYHSCFNISKLFLDFLCFFVCTKKDRDLFFISYRLTFYESKYCLLKILIGYIIAIFGDVFLFIYINLMMLKKNQVIFILLLVISNSQLWSCVFLQFFIYSKINIIKIITYITN